MALLRSLAIVSSDVKADALLPTVQDFIQSPAPAHGLVPVLGPHAEEFATLVVSSFDASSADHLNDKSLSLWPVFLQMVHYFTRSGRGRFSLLFIVSHVSLVDGMQSAHSVLVQILKSGLSLNLHIDRKIELCQLLLELGAKDGDAVRN